MTDLAGSNIARGRKRAEASVARSLSLAATPAFAIMALLTAVHGDGMPDMICSAAPDGSLLTGMVPMYLLMSAFHLGPWLKLLSRPMKSSTIIPGRCEASNPESRIANRAEHQAGCSSLRRGHQ